MFRFIHSSDLHIGKRFGNMPEDLRGRLREARHSAISRLAEQARVHGASTILLAGDTFDTETPTPAMLRQAMAEMSQSAPLRWILLPGNHDSLLADQLWSAADSVVPDNVLLATRPEVSTIAADVALLPAPCTTRRPGRDLTEWMDSAATPQGAIRLGLAHGAIQAFSEDSAASDIIAPDRAAKAGLDYLALGDWHGPVAINERSRYSGAPEPDRFKHDTPGQALVVSIAGPGAMPEIAAVETASFSWKTAPLHLLSGDDSSAAFEALLPPVHLRRQTLLRIAASGRVRLSGRTALQAAIAAAAPDFAYLELDGDGLATDCESGDLDRIDRSGALREAAQALLDESSDETRSAVERDISREALVRLFSYCEAIGS
ncbi:MAG: DNA repair exonuclease [Mesorhizobium sp.]|uniref:metallophosphoesterase family protein n=1 Tax=unclassified Mesorhizobium TaxID=325217 RepID=UPI000FE4C617|nr:MULTISPECIES: DNA repair exonuclease [unclassified Mesorhizobium]RWH78111.1 MAG: DNA repair exonuclease [Mesorhizobium sp.]RWM45170.1 MAG: DNA repair exonuclease [Mesorhizobium sp.]BCH12894.1 exonuclease [Mesorhizobium sp. 131-3-5]